METYSPKSSDHLKSRLLEPEQAPVKQKRVKKPINCSVTIHDRTQIETTFDYYLFRGNGNSESEQIHYRVSAFFFYPQQFGINPSSYPKEKFYNDIRPLIRFREPKLRYKRIIGQKVDKSSPIGYLRDYHELLQQGRMTEPVLHALDEVHLFACTFISTFFKSIDRSRVRLKKIVKDPVLAADSDIIESFFVKMTQFLTRADEALCEFRKLLPLYADLPEGFSRAIYQEIRLIDEYCYYRLRDGIALLLQIVNPQREHLQHPAVQSFYDLVQSLLDSHDKYALEQKFVLINEQSSVVVKEKHLHRRGELKRRIWKVLFVEIRNKPLFAFQRQFGAMIAAGLAAAWAVIAQIILVRHLMMKENTADMLGLGGLVFLMAGIFAYVIKDRIKDIGRSYFRGGLFREVPDQSETIYYRDGSGKQTAIGAIKENARFESIAKIPAELLKTRHLNALENSETEEEKSFVLHYRKDITLSKKIKILGRYPLRAVHDILRMDIEECLSKLGEPMRGMEHVVDGCNVKEIHLPKIYYLDIGLVYSSLDDKMKPSETSFEYFRLVINKDGLLRIDRLS